MTNSRTPFELRAYANRLREIADSLYIDAARLEKEQTPAILIEVKIIAKNGELSNKTYDYQFDQSLEPGQVVVVPSTQRWQAPVSYATVIRSSGTTGAYVDGLEAIERVVR
jgi:hypothetical protein